LKNHKVDALGLGLSSDLLNGVLNK